MLLQDRDGAIVSSSHKMPFKNEGESACLSVLYSGSKPFFDKGNKVHICVWGYITQDTS